MINKLLKKTADNLEKLPYAFFYFGQVLIVALKQKIHVIKEFNIYSLSDMMRKNTAEE